jgi:tryptophanyl-tRNA synthetase
MEYSILYDLSNKSKTGLVKRQIVELLRAGICNENQILDTVGISRKLLRSWNRYYQRYRNKNLIFGRIKPCVMKKTTNELAALKRRMADLEQHNEKLQLQNEALTTMIDLAERQFKIPIRKKSGPKQ